MEIKKKNDRRSDFTKSVEVLEEVGEDQEPLSKRKL